ncbi:hypothetical protein FACS189487_05050 [Campylobacterota bacterium]|nr:hypothetical protein FACS189487_05050 [Campylobacterota bacterium]
MANERLYARAKVLFEDNEGSSHFVMLSRTSQIYSRIEDAFKNAFRILLITGAPGTGKSYVLKRFFGDYKAIAPIFLYSSATFSSERLFEIYESLYKERLVAKDLQGIIDAFRVREIKPISILLDEAQLYDEDRLELVRMLSNEGIFRFVVVVHRVKNEDLLARDHFRTRTYENIECTPIEPIEVERFIETKLLLGEIQDFYSRFDKKNLERIFEITQGNLRDLNRLIHRFFDLLDDMEQNAPHKLPKRFTNKLIEMSALELGML